MNFCFRLLPILLLLPLLLSAQTDKNKCHKSTEGTEFWFGFMENRWYSGNNYVEVTVTAREATTFSIYIGNNLAPVVVDETVGNNESKQIRIPLAAELIEATGSETVQDRGIYLESIKPVNVYALNYDKNSADVAVIYPVQSLGTKYVAMCYTPHLSLKENGYYEGKNSEFLIVATEDTTIVSIIPSVITDKNRPAGISFLSDTLNAGEIYQVQSLNANYQGQGDLTGSQITSNKPIAFYSGALATTVPYTPTMCCYDHLFEQIPPVHSWGKEYYIVPLRSREQDRYRIVATEPNTKIFIGNGPPIYLNPGNIHEFTLQYDEPVRVLSDNPIMIAQFSQSKDVDNQFTSNNGDPFMIILSPTSQAKNDVTFVAYSSTQIKRYYINIITLTSETGNLQMTGSSGPYSIQGNFLPFTGTDYSYAQIQLSNGTYRLWNSNPDRGFLAYVYGFGTVESYGYGVGFNLDLLLDLGKSINFNGDTLLLCYGDTRTLDAGPYFDTYLWSDSTAEQKLTVTEEGEYWALTTTNDGCKLFDSIFIKVSRREIELPLDSAEGCYPFSVQLTADSSFAKYFWKDEQNNLLSAEPSVTLDKTGDYRLTVYNEYDCPAFDTFKLTVFDIPELNIIGDTLVCGDTITTLLAELKNADPELWNYGGSKKWWSNKPGKVQFSSPDSVLTQMAVTERGEYEVYFLVATKDGCEVSDTLKILFQATPVSAFDFGDDPKCKGYSKKLIFKGSASLEAEFFWDLDGCMFVDTIGVQQYNVTVGAFLDEPPYIQLSINDHGCLSDTTIHPLGANPIYRMDAYPTRGCDSLEVDFSCELLKPDIVEYKWDFGGNDISNEPNVSKFYGNPGFYDVSLTIINPVTQCMNGFTLDSMIKVFPTPIAKILADESACYPDSFQAIYINNIDSSFCSWSFIGAYESGKNNDSIVVVIDSSMAEITLVAEEFGCPSEPVSKIVKRFPHFDFTTDTLEGCQPFQIQTLALPYDDSLSFYWMYDSLPPVNSGIGTYYFDGYGKFGVGLYAVSGQTQCTDTLYKPDWVEVHPKPEAVFEVDYPVATIEHPAITFTNLSGPGLNFSWDFGDGVFSEEGNPRHTYTRLGDYKSRLNAATGFGCLDTAFLTIEIVPFSIYTPNAFRPGSDIAENRVFMPVGIGADPSKFNIKIFNRWGNLVFESNNPENKWDGKMPNGIDAPMGNYAWFALFDDIQGFGHQQSGQVLLIR